MATPRSAPRAGAHTTLGLALVLGLLTACGAPGSGPPTATDPPTDTDPIDTTNVARIIVTPGSLLLTTAGASAELHATVLDASGETVDAAVTWDSSDPSIATVDADGTLTAIGPIGVTQVTAHADGVSSAPVLAVVATPVEGAVLVSDAQVVTDIEPLDPEADVGLGWRYRARLSGIEPPEVGAAMIGTGEQPIGGRVVTVEADGDDVLVTLEVVGLDALFTALRVEAAIDLALVDAELPPEIVEGYTVTRLPDGTLEFVPREAVEPALHTASTAEFEFGLFRCEATLGAFPLRLPKAPSFSLKVPNLGIYVDLDDEHSLQQVGLAGVLEAQIRDLGFTVQPFAGKVACETELMKLTVPFGGPLALVFGAQVPIGVGFEVDGSLVLAELGLNAGLTTEAQFDVGYDRSLGDWQFRHSATATTQPKFEFVWPAPTDQMRAALSLHAFAFADLKLGSRWSKALGFKLVRTTAGAEHRVDVAGRTAQWKAPNYASDFVTEAKAVATAGTGTDYERLEQLLGIKIKPLEVTLVQFELGRSPKGSLAIEPETVLARTGEDPVGELATFTVTLDRNTHFGLGSVRGVEIWWERRNSSDELVLMPGRDDCHQLAGAGLTFTCQTDFLESHEGTNAFVAFVEASMFGVPLPFPLQLTGTGGTPARATVDVEVGDPGYRVRLEPPRVTFPERVAPGAGGGVFTLVNEGRPIDFVTTNALGDNDLTVIGPTSGRLEESGTVDIGYSWTCDAPVQKDFLIGLAFSDGGEPVGGLLTSSFSLSVTCVDKPDPPCEGPACDDPDWGGDGGDDEGDFVDAGGTTGSSWGDPHLITLDGRAYDFHATGDYVLSKSTDPTDDFEVQVRYRALRPGEPWHRADFGISVGIGVAASVHGHVVNVLVTPDGEFEVHVDGEVVSPLDDLALELPNRGTVRVEGGRATIGWRDSTSVTLVGTTAQRLRFDYLDDVRLYVPTRRFGKVEGLLGDADRDASNDLRVRGGEVLESASPALLYGAFRESWRVPLASPDSLFAVGPDLYDADFPGFTVTLADFTEAERAVARAVCEAVGVVSQAVLQGCMLDVLITGDDAAAEAAFLADPATPKVAVTPSLAYVYAGADRFFGAVISGAPELRAEWTATDGTIVALNELYARFTAPAEAGLEIELTATLAGDGRIRDTTRIVVLEGRCPIAEGFDRTWQGGVSDDWSNGDNWAPGGVPTSAERAFVCATATRQPRLSASTAVGGLTVTPGAQLRLGSATLSVHGDLDLAAGSVAVESGSLRVVGDGAVLAGTLPTITINALTAAGGPLTVDGNLTLGLDRPAHLDPNGHTLNVLGNLATTNVGCLVSTLPRDRVVIQGATTLNGWSNQSHCALTAGTLELHGDLTTTAGQLFDRLTPDPGHTTRLTGTTHQTITIGGLALGHPSGNRFHDLEIANPAGVTFTEPVDVRGDVRFTANAGPVSGATTVHLDGAIDEPQGGARWQVATTNLRGPARDVLLPGTLPGHLVVNSQIVLGHPLTVEGNLTIATTGAARLDPGPHTLTIVGDLTTVSGQNVNGCLAMTHPAALVVVQGDARFNGYMGAGGCAMTDGVMELLGDFGTANIWNSMFTPSGDHVVRFTGTGSQEVAFGDTAEHPSGNRFQHVEIVNAAGVTFSQNARVEGQLDLVGRMTNQAVLTIPLGGSLLLRSGSYLDNLVGSIALGGTCTAEPGADGEGIPPACLTP